MPKRIVKVLVGGLKPWKPKRSLPSYKEPTPETSPKLSREEEAELALKRTAFTPGTPLVLVLLFLFTIASVPLMQLGAELRTRTAGAAGLPMFNVFKALPSAAQIAAARTLQDVWNLLPQAEELKSAEKALETDSVVSQWLLPPVQSVLTSKLGAGNEQVYLGREGWLFYRADVDYVTGPPFLASARLRHRAHSAGVEPDPVKAIVHFRDQLAARGIDLLVLPVPTKTSLEGEKLSARTHAAAALQNPSFDEFKARLETAGVRIFDPTPLLIQRKTSGANAQLYLQKDTHWRPETMEFVAQQLAVSLNLRAASDDRTLQSFEVEVSGIGDLARMLRLPANDPINAPEKITVRQVTKGNAIWQPSSDSNVLILGDSFANIFSLEALGWGEGAGFVEHLSLALGGRPLDCILRNSDGAFATREMLAKELARGRDRLEGKKLVIWEFAARELAFGNWKLLKLKSGSAATARFFSPPPGQEIEVAGTIETISSAPRPGTVPYKDHIVTAQVGELAVLGGAPGEALQSIVYLVSMRDNVWTPAARLRVGDRVKLRLRAWSDVARQYEQINRTEIDDAALQLEEPVWGELLK
ncbi:MAG: hypothetical protein ABR589_04075 [Chthoniobacterales bacterium]